MAGTKEGGRKARETNIRRHGKDYYQRIGAEGGRHSCTGGFASDKVGKDGLTGRQRASLVGAIGGFRSRRRPSKKEGEKE